MFKSFAFAAAIALGLGFTAAPASAAALANGFVLNGFVVNGMRQQGVNLHGLQMNGTAPTNATAQPASVTFTATSVTLPGQAPMAVAMPVSIGDLVDAAN